MIYKDSPLKHIKQALEECNNDIDQSKLWLKKKGFKDAENKKSRETNTKLVGIKSNTERDKLAISLVSCETEFVANTDHFKDFSKSLLDTVLVQSKYINEGDYSAITLASESYHQFKGASITEGLKLVITKTQENCNIKCTSYLPISDNECVGIYLHSSPCEHLGAKGSYIVLRSETKIEGALKDKLNQLANNLAMHIVAANTKYLKKSDVPNEVLEREKAILEEQSKNVAENKDYSKILKNKIDKWFEENVLLEQVYLILDYDELNKPKKISEVIKNFAKENQINNLEVKEFKLFL